MSKPTRPVLRYHGGKWKLAPWLISHFPEHRVYVEPFGGAASVLMWKDRSYAEVYNDKWDTVVNVFRVLRDRPQQIERSLRLTPFSRSEFLRSSAQNCRPKKIPDIEAARLAILRSFAGIGSASINGDHATGFRSCAKRRGTIPAHDWNNYPKLIQAFAQRLAGVVIENRDAAEIIGQHDSPETLFYCDPPYPLSERTTNRGNAAYQCDMTDDDHRATAKILHTVQGMVILSGYPCELYDQELYPGWARFERQTMADGARKRTEVLWLNPAAAERMPQKRLDLQAIETTS